MKDEELVMRLEKIKESDRRERALGLARSLCPNGLHVTVLLAAARS